VSRLQRPHYFRTTGEKFTVQILEAQQPFADEGYVMRQGRAAFTFFFTLADGCQGSANGAKSTAVGES
jgi:hypothetical protein